MSKFEQYLERDPDNIPLLLDAFDHALAGGQIEQAGAYVGKAFTLDAQDPHVLHCQAKWFAATGKWDAAIDVERGLCARFPAEADLRLGLASLLFHAGRYQQAVQSLDSIDTPGSPQPAAIALKIRCLHHCGDLDGAALYFGTHETAFGSHPEVAGAGGLVFLDIGDFPKAKALAQTALSVDAECVEALTTDGSVAVGEHDLPRAQRLLSRASSLRPGEGRVWSALGVAALLGGDEGSARRHFEQATALMPAHIGSWHGLAWSLIAASKAPEAHSTFLHALTLDRNFAETHGGLAVTSALLGDARAASDHIDVAFRLDDQSLAAHYAQAILSGDVHNLDKFQKQVARVLGRVKAPDGRSLAQWMVTLGVRSGSRHLH